MTAPVRILIAHIRNIDHTAIVERVTDGPNKGKFYLSTRLRIPPHGPGEAPVAESVGDAIRAFWSWIVNVPPGQWITLPGIPDRQSQAYRWNGRGWDRRR